MKKSVVLAVVAFCAVFIAQPAMAVAWGPISSVYNGQTVVRGEGDYYNYAYSHAVSRIDLEDSLVDGNTVYGRTGFRYFYSVAGQAEQWRTKDYQTTPEIGGSGTFRLVSPLRAESSETKGAVQVCAQMGFPVPDSCGNAVPSFSY